jgi:hypothetical protein
MRNSHLIVQLTWAAVLSIAAPAAGYAEAPPLLAVQGYLTNPDGVPIDGDHRVIFFLYDAETDGAVLHTDSFNNLELNRGSFFVYLGSQEDQELDLGLFRDNQDMWLEVVVDNETISPRTRLASVGYAGFAQTCGDATTLQGNESSAFAPADHTHTSRHVAPIVRSASTGNYWLFDCPGPVTVAGTEISISVDVPSVLDLSWAGLVSNPSPSGATYTRIRVNGTEVGNRWGGIRNSATPVDFATTANVATAEVGAGDHTIDVSATCDGAVGTAQIAHGTLKVVAWATE